MIIIVNYGVGNLASIQNILKRIGIPSRISSEKNEILDAEKLIFPGVGAFDNCAQRFAVSGLEELLNEKVLIHKTPVLGICVGMQLMFSESEEGNEKGLDWIPGKVKRFDATKLSGNLKIPHMGWTDVHVSKPTSLMEGLQDDPRFYFVHSYHVQLENADDELLAADHGYRFTAAVERENIIGVQFHPEKSHKFGMKLLENFATRF